MDLTNCSKRVGKRKRKASAGVRSAKRGKGAKGAAGTGAGKGAKAAAGTGAGKGAKARAKRETRLARKRRREGHSDSEESLAALSDLELDLEELAGVLGIS